MRPDNPDTLSQLAYRIDDAARITGLSRSTLYKLRKAGELAMLSIGGRTVITHAELERLLASKGRN